MIEVEAPDGSIVEFPDGTPDQVIRDALAKTYGAPRREQSMASGLFDRFTNEAAFGFGPRLEGVEAGLLGKHPAQGDSPERWFDYSGTFGSRFDAAYNAEKEQLARFAEEHPGASLTAGLAGALSTPTGAARAGLTLAGAGLRSVGSRIAAGMAEGMGYGALSGAGHSERGEELGGAVGGGIVGGLLGGAASGAVSAIRRALPARRSPAPTLAELQAGKTAAYQAAEQTGARYSPQAFRSLVDVMTADAKAANISALRHPKASSMLSDLEALSQAEPNGLTLTRLDQLRQVIRRDVVNAGDDAEAHFGREMIRAIDDFIEGAGEAQMLSGDAGAANEAITAARAANVRLRRAEVVDDALNRADLRAASTGSGGNVENAMRQNIRGILDNPRKRQGFSAEELSAMEAFVRGSRSQNVLRQIGKLSPQGNGLMGMLGVGGTFANPTFAAVPVAGFMAKQVADRNARNAARALSAQIRRGAPAPTAAEPLSPVERQMLIDALAAYGGGRTGEAMSTSR